MQPHSTSTETQAPAPSSPLNSDIAPCSHQARIHHHVLSTILHHFALCCPSSSVLAVIYVTAASRGVKGGCAPAARHPHARLMPVWLPKELGTAAGSESSAALGEKDLPKVTRQRDRKAPREAPEPQPRGGGGSAAPCAGEGWARRG